MPEYEGLIPAVFTPMKENGSINTDMIKQIVEYLIEKEVSGVYVCGTTGEGASLTTEERCEVVRAYTESVSGRIKVIVQVGHNSLFEAKNMARYAMDVGADAIAAVPPEYFKPRTVENLVDCMCMITEGLKNMPFFYYHIPTLTGVNFDMVDFLKVGGQKINGFAGIKYSSTTIYEFQACREYENGKYTILFGCDEMLLSALAVGAVGAVGSTYNFAAPLYKKIINAYKEGRKEDACKYQSLSVNLVRLLYRHDNTVQPALKGLMKLIGLDCGPNRLPLISMNPEKLAAMREELQQLGFFEWGCK